MGEGGAADKRPLQCERPTRVPLDAFSLWNLIRDYLVPLPEVTTIPLLRGDREEIPRREIEIRTSLFISLADVNLPPPEELLGCPLEDILIPTLLSCPRRRRPNWKRRLGGVKTLPL
jgi:hypothetical protein